jgi:putative molybdopterin biosynthesis protein
MSKQPLVNRLRELRERAGMSQLAFAAAVRLTRQSVSAIEAGRVTPAVDVALRLAQVLGCRVEELFIGAASDELPVELGAEAALEGARASVAEVRGRWVAHALDADGGSVSADGLVGTAPGARGVQPLRSEAELRENVLVMGCALGLGVLADRLNARRGAGRFVWLSRSSTEALEQLSRGRVHVAGVHLMDPHTGEPNVHDVRRILPSTSLALITLARWQVGWVTAPGNPKRIRTALDLAGRGVRLVSREPGSGARRCLDAELRRAELPAELARSAALCASGHLDVARAVAFGAADTGLATLDAARAFGLDLVPLAEERYDLVVPLTSLSEPRIMRLLDALSAGPARRELAALGYDTSASGDRAAELHVA